ncbi:MAG: helix-turn-helix domain-containing protein [Halieaceae bacterium]
MDYGQFCPVAKAAEVLGEKWTILILRELLYGTSRFSEFQRAISGISPTMLNKRLKELEAQGLVTKQDHEYALTPGGWELGPLVRQYAIWGMRWARSDLSEAELDVELLMWDIRRRIKAEFLPPDGCLIHIHVRDLDKQADWWLPVAEQEVTLEKEAPEGEEDLLIEGDLETLTRLWLGDTTLHQALAQRRLTLKGRPILIRAIEQWLPLASYANVRPASAD